MFNWSQNSDTSALKEIGVQLRHLRLVKNISQASLAEATGLDRSTIGNLEHGRSTSLLTLIKVLRALDKLELLSPFFQLPQISPLQVAKMKGNQRERASSPRTPKEEKPASKW
ncbi:MAG TPA: XRE family transcriptional regulator [Bacteroidetes bacterium]|nr:XRE family transcriptional regulator [Bacteroidota bacterium]